MSDSAASGFGLELIDVQEIDRRWRQVADEFFELAGDAFGAVVRVDQREGVWELCRKAGEGGACRSDRVGIAYTAHTARVIGSRLVKLSGPRGPVPGRSGGGPTRR